MPLTAKQERFKNGILAGLNATNAAKDANYAPNAKNRDNVCGVEGNRLLRNAKIKQAIDEQKAELSEVVNNKRADILKETMRIAYAPNSPMVSTGDKLRALELCGKECEGGIWTDKIGGGVDQAPPLTPEQAARYAALARAENVRLSKGQDEKTA